MTCTLPLAELKKFLAKSNEIPANVLYPALDSIKIKIEDGRVSLVKSNMNIFLTRTFSDTHMNENCNFTVNEKTLTNFANIYEAEVMVFEVDENLTTMRLGKRKQDTATEDARTFPQAPTRVDLEFTLLAEDLKNISIASKFINEVGAATVLNFVHLGEHGVFGSNGSYIFYYENRSGLPATLLSDEACRIVGKFTEECKFNTSPSYDFFYDDEFTYAVIKTHFKTFDFKKVVQAESGPHWSINREDLVRFCRLISANSKKELPIATVRQEQDGVLILDYIDADFSRNAHDEIAVTGAYVEEFKISVNNLLRALNALPYTTLNWAPFGKHYKLTSPEAPGFIGVVSGVN